jgi:hypothetical protein
MLDSIDISSVLMMIGIPLVIISPFTYAAYGTQVPAPEYLTNLFLPIQIGLIFMMIGMYGFFGKTAGSEMLLCILVILWAVASIRIGLDGILFSMTRIRYAAD